MSQTVTKVAKEASRYDVRNGGKGGHGKADIVREVGHILCYKSAPNADKGGGGQKIQKFGRCHYWRLPNLNVVHLSQLQNVFCFHFTTISGVTTSLPCNCLMGECFETFCVCGVVSAAVLAAVLADRKRVRYPTTFLPFMPWST